MSDDADRLIHRHLEGDLSEEDSAALGARLKSDPGFRRRLAEMAFDRAQMKDVLSKLPGAVEPARVSRRGLLPMAAAAIIVAAVGLAVAMWSFRETPPAPPVAPAAPTHDRPYSGPLTVKVASRTEVSTTFRVTAVPGHPAHPLVGKRIHVVVGWAKNADGEPVQDRTHVNYLRKLAVDQEETVDVRHQKDDIYAIGDLTSAQQEWANRRGDPVKRTPDRPRRDPAPREGQERDNPPRERPREE
jgi:hypothetical protein